MNHRMHYENNLKNDIKQMKHYNQKDRDKIERLQRLDDDYFINQVMKARENIQNRLAMIEKLEQDILRCQNGEFDQQFRAERRKNMEESNQRDEQMKRKRFAEAEQKRRQGDEIRLRDKQDRNEDRRSRNLKRDMDRSYDYYLKLCSSIPEYMMRNLKEMPNNKGYIWRGMYLYGKLPYEEDKPRVIFEKPQRDVLHIHEWYKGEYRKYEKIGKDRKQLIDQKITLKRHKEIGNLLDFLVK